MVISLDFTFIIASNRPIEEYAGKVITSINNAKDSNKFSYEILISHPKKVCLPNTKFFIDKQENGPISSFNRLATLSKGDCIISMSDSVCICCNFEYWANILNKMFTKRKIQIGGTGHDQTPKVSELTNVMADIIRFPFVTRKSLYDSLCGYLFHPEFYYHYSDSWIGVWTTLIGEPAIEYGYFNCFTNISHEFNSKYDIKDLSTLLKLSKNFKKNSKYTAE